MNRIFSVFLVVIMLFTVLTGCKNSENNKSAQPNSNGNQQSDAPKTFTRNGATIELPANFFDYSESPIGEDHSFLFGSDNMGIMGDEHQKSETAFTSLDQFVQSLADTHSVQATQKDGFWTITYEDITQNEPQIYICAFYETQSSYWIVSAYCPDRMLEDYKADMWNFATNVRF